MAITFFDNIDPYKLENYYSRDIAIGDKEIQIDLNFEQESLTREEVSTLNAALDSIEILLGQSWKWIMDDYKNGSDVAEYITIHLEDFFAEDPEELLKGTDPALDNTKRFFQILEINRIGVYPSSPDSYIVLDYMVDEELSNYILVVVVNDKLKLEYITIES